MAKKAKKTSGFARGAKKAAEKKKGPRSQVLPGMKQARNQRLDNICEGIAEERSIMNAASVEEKSLIATALQVMQTKDITVYKHGGIELVRVPGADKLRVRLSKEDGNSDVSGGVTTRGEDNEGSDPAPADDNDSNSDNPFDEL